VLKSNLKLAYNDFLPINKAKYLDIKKLLNYVILPNNTFYNDHYLKFKEPETYNINTTELFNNISHCDCKGKCLRKCLCKINGKNCETSCLCDKNLCKNFINQ
jgi:hypothetical protein